MKFKIEVSDDNVAEIAAAFGYVDNPLDKNLVTDAVYAEQAITDLVRARLINYRARISLATESSKASTL